MAIKIKVPAGRKSVQEVGQNKVPPTKAVDTQEAPQNIGFVVEHADRKGSLVYSKILTKDPKSEKHWITVLFHRPTVRYNLGAVVTFDFGEYQGNPTATNVELLSDESPMAEFFEYAKSASEFGDLEIIQISHLAKAFMRHTHTGSNPTAWNAFLKFQNIYTIVGFVDENRIVVRRL